MKQVVIESLDDFIECYEKSGIKESKAWWQLAAKKMSLWDTTINQFGSEKMKEKYLGEEWYLTPSIIPKKVRKVINS